MPTAQTEEYLETIRRLEERGEPATTSALARDLRVSAPAVTEMVGRLAQQGYVTRQQRGEIHLTPTGSELGTTIVRRHRLWERFLTDVLGLPWDRVHGEACRLEHATSPDTEARLAAMLGEASTCPHGYAIPGLAGPTDPATTRLGDVAPGQHVRVISVDEDAQVLRALDRLGIHPDATIRLDARTPAGDLLASVGGHPVTIPADLQAQVAVAPAAADTPAPDAPITLADLPVGQPATVLGISAGSTVAARCLALGFTPGARVDMVQNAGRGAVIALVRDTRVALGRGEAGKITVSLRQPQADRM